MQPRANGARERELYLTSDVVNGPHTLHVALLHIYISILYEVSQ